MTQTQIDEILAINNNFAVKYVTNVWFSPNTCVIDTRTGEIIVRCTDGRFGTAVEEHSSKRIYPECYDKLYALFNIRDKSNAVIRNYGDYHNFLKFLKENYQIGMTLR